MINDIISKTAKSSKVVIVYKIEDIDKIIIDLNDHIPLIVNVMNLNKKVAYRMVDFLSGYCYAKKGKYKKIDKLIYKFEI